MKLRNVLLVVALLSIIFMLFARVGQKPFVDRTDCVGCGDCVRECPTAAITLVNGHAFINEELCIDCKFCVKNCTYRAIRTAK